MREREIEREGGEGVREGGIKGGNEEESRDSGERRRGEGGREQGEKAGRMGRKGKRVEDIHKLLRVALYLILSSAH